MAEFRRLKRDLVRVTEERDILKRLQHISRACPVEVCFLPAMCHVLMDPVSGFHAWLQEPLSHPAQEDARQTELIRQAWAESGKVYGCRKIADDLRDRGKTYSQNPVARLASLTGIAA